MDYNVPGHERVSSPRQLVRQPGHVAVNPRPKSAAGLPSPPTATAKHAPTRVDAYVGVPSGQPHCVSRQRGYCRSVNSVPMFKTVVN